MNPSSSHPVSDHTDESRALRLWLDAGVLSPLDFEFALLLRRLGPTDHPIVATTAALVSRATQAGHVCLDLNHAGTLRFADKDGKELTLELPSPSEWRQQLEVSSVVGDGGRPTPLVLVDGRVYLHRYFDYERRLRENLQQRLASNAVPLAPSTRTSLLRLFAKSERGDLQRLAAFLASVHRFCVISGGPGTGKTTTVAKVLALLSEQFVARGETLKLSLLAPTGKAATRLAESLEAGLTQLDLSESSRALLRVEPSTIHRALGYQPRTPTRFRHGPQNLLRANVVIVDEAAMVDLALMTKLCEAVPITSHLLLLGDRDQLASVEAGAVFGDLFNSDGPTRYSPALVAALETSLGEGLPAAAVPLPPIADCTVHLEKSYRYAENGGIARLARSVRAGDFNGALAALGSEEVTWIQLTEEATLDVGSDQQLYECVQAGFTPLRRARSAEARLDALSRFRLLSPHRRGTLGVEGLNALAEKACLPAHLRDRETLYPGQPILVQENDYQAELYNGDVGVIEQTKTGKLAAFFPDGAGLRQLSLARLPAHSTVYAMTIHKSQGSEFDQVVVVLPHHASPLLSRELLYTGITRAKKRVVLVASQMSLRVAIERRVERSSGLRRALWGAG